MSSPTQVDYIIAGHGLCGMFLSYYLRKEGCTVMVFDESRPSSSTKVASGVINPVTGRRIVRTWRIEELLPFAQHAYAEMEASWQIPVVTNCAVLDFHPSLQMKQAFEQRQPEESTYLHHEDESAWADFFHFYFGVGKIAPCLHIDLLALLHASRQELIQQQALREVWFEMDHCTITEDRVFYQDIQASAIIFCDGVAGTDNPYFKNLPFAPNKGEALIVSIPGLSAGNIYKSGLSIVPWHDGLFWVGSSYQWNFDHDQPTEAFRLQATTHLQRWLKLPFEVVDHLASVRPANVERRPFVGMHPTHRRVGIFNGMGTKGCSLAPFFGHQFAQHLAHGRPLYPDADVARFTKVLSRQ